MFSRSFAIGLVLRALLAQTESLPPEPLAPNDLIALAVYGSADLSSNFRIDPNGELRLPLLPRPIQARGLLPSQLAGVIADTLKREKIMVKPFVTVSVLEYGSRPVTVIGAVQRPLTFPVSGGLTVLGALARAGGLAPEAGPEILLTVWRGADGASQPELVRIPVRSLMHDADSRVNYRLTGGEEIRVPEMGRVYVLGNVKWPGDYTLRAAAPTTVLKLLARAGGPGPFARQEAILYRRVPGSSSLSEIRIPLNRILEEKSEDLALQPEDVLYLPEAKGRRLTKETVDRILSLGGLAGAAVLLDRR